MPLPKPKEGESKNEYVSRCISYEHDQSPARPQEQIVAMCHTAWRDRNKTAKQKFLQEWQEAGEKSMIFMHELDLPCHCDLCLSQGKNPLKAISSTDEELRVGNYIVLFGGRDLEGHGSERINPDGSKGEYFSPRTELESRYTKAGALYVDWEHTQAELGDELLGVVDWKTAKADDKGVFVERVLTRRNQYVQWVEGLIEQGLIGTSSQAVGDGVKKAADGEILRWPLERDTLTVVPMDYRNLKEFGDNTIQAFKALGIPVPEHTPKPEAEPEVVEASATVTAGKASNTESEETTNQEVSMSEEQTTTNEAPEKVDVAAIAAEAAKTAAEEAVKAYRESLAKEPPITTGLVVTEAEEDKALKARPFTGLGEFLMAVKNAAIGDTDKRLKALRSPDPADEGGFSLTKALGADFVGGITKSAFSYLKQTGLHTGTGPTGGFLVDTDHDMSIMQRVYEQGDLLQRVAMDGISAGANGMTYNLVNETSRADGSRMGGIRAYWTAEGGAKTASKPEFRQLSLRLQKVAALVYATDEQLQDANALESWIMRNLPDEIRFVVEDSIINGTGVGMPQGILVSAGLTSVAKETGQAADTVTVPNIVKMWSRMWARSRRNSAWFIHQDLEPQLFQLQLPVGTGGQAVYMPPGGLSASPYATLMGRPVVPIEYCQTVGTVGDIILGDFSQYQMIEKGGIQSASSIHVQFVYDETVFRFVYRVAGQNTWNSELTPKNGTNTVSPFVVLASRD